MYCVLSQYICFYLRFNISIMKRSQMYKKINRRNNVFNHLNRNVVYPSLFLSPDEINKQGSVEIIELKSDEEPAKEQRDKSNYSHVWCYESDDQENNYRINKEARERRRCQMEYDKDQIYNDLFDQMCTNFYGMDCHYSLEPLDGTSGNREAKCFTIIDNHLPFDTSSDDEEAEYCDTILNGNETKERSFDDNVNCNNGYAEKRTVWIYSEKNKKELLEDYDFKNNPNSNSTSSSTTDNEDPIRDINLGCIRRLATPIPTYIPKLFLPLSPKLPTVTEVMESYNKSSSNTEINQSNSMTPQMPINNWVQEQTEDHENDVHHKENNKTFTWDALSAREKRRIKNSMKEENCNIDKIDQQLIIVNQSESAKQDSIETEINHPTSECTSSGIELKLKSTSSEEINNLQRPQIKLNLKIKPSSDIITEPLEKENGKWIGDETDETLDVYDYDLDQTDAAKDTSDVLKEDSGGKQFLVSNMSLLKPAEWTQYLPLAGSIPSLHLSFETEIEEKKSWLRRFFNCLGCWRRCK